MNGESEVSDSELFQRARTGDRAAFGELVDRHKDSLVNYLTRLCGNSEQAEDLAQESFLRLYQRGNQYREQGKLQAYLFRIATNLFHSQIRREQRWLRLRSLFLAANGHQPEPPQQSRLLQGELGEQLATALLRVPIRYRTPLVLAFVEGWSHREIAAAMECQEGTVKSRIHRGRKLLRAELEPYHDGESP